MEIEITLCLYSSLYWLYFIIILIIICSLDFLANPTYFEPQLCPQTHPSRKLVQNASPYLHSTHFLTIIKQGFASSLLLYGSTQRQNLFLCPQQTWVAATSRWIGNIIRSSLCILCLYITSSTTCCHLTLIPVCSPSQTAWTVYSSHSLVARWAHTKIIENTRKMRNLTL